MRLRLTRAGRSADVVVTLPDGSTPLSTLLQAAGVDPLPGRVDLDGRTTAVADPVGSLALHDGSAIGLDPVGGSPSAAASGAALQLVQVAGGLSGRSTILPIGLHDVGPAGSAGRVEAPVLRIGVEAGDTLTLETVGRGAIRLDGMSLAGPALEPIRAGMHIAAADALFRVGPARPTGVPDGRPGHVRYQRTPRSAPPADPPVPAAPERPTPATPAPQLSWAMVLTPIPIAVGMALLLSPHFLVFAAFTPLMAIGRWAEGAWRKRRSERLLAEERTVALAEYETALAAYAAGRASALRRASPDLAALLERTRDGRPGLWAQRPGAPGFLQVPVGYGDRPGTWDVPAAPDPAVYGLAVRYRRLPDVPISIDFDRHRGVGLTGTEGVVDLAATALVHAAATHGPAHLQLAVVCDADRIAHWDWLKWLPHLADAAGRPVVATTVAEVAELFGNTGRSAGPGSGASPIRIVVIDSTVLVDAVLTQLAEAPDQQRIRLAVIAASPERLPAICTQVVMLREARVTVTDLVEATTVRGVLPACADPRTVSKLARGLARYLDPEAETRGVSLPRRIDLAQLLGGGGLGTDAVRARWTRSGSELLATLGATEDGPLVVDLIADGPHMLVAGTTGSGKSELLRTLVGSLACRYGPDRLNVVLIDFKGGGAFDACADLPQTVGVVTDLDDQLAARALRCLRAEVRHRERVLRAAGVSDLADLRGPLTPARLVLVVDEFATLANELPDFMGSLVDIAQRGRSLGIHLVLATQRPSGVVDSKIRANTNLRLALRVQSDADSFDVLASAVASRIDRRTPGRGYALLGAGELRAFQTALVSTSTPLSGPQSIQVEAFTLASSTSSVACGSAAPPAPTGAATDLQRIVEASRAAAAGMAPARVPWPAPLPDRIDAVPLWEKSEPVPGTVHLGLVDRPDDQRVDAFRWDHRRGPLLAYGSDPTATTGVIVTAAADLARRNAADALHLYLFDFVPGSGLERLAELPQVAAHVGPGDHERLLRAVDALERELDRRRETARGTGSSAGNRTADDPQPLIMIGLAGYHHALAVAEELGRLDLPGRLERLVTEGSPLGIVTVLTTHHERGVPGRLASQIAARIAFRLADPAAYTGFGIRPKAVPDLRGQRALDLASGDEVLIATPAAITSAGLGRGGPRPVENLAERVPAAAVAGHSRRDASVWRLAIGLRHSDLSPATVSLHPGHHLVITGGPASGRTTTLRTLVDASRTAGPTDVRLLTQRPEQWSERWPEDVGLRIGPGALADPIRQPTLVVVDVLDAAADLDARLTALADDPEVRIVVTDRVDSFRMPATWLRRVLAGRTGLLLQPQPDHGDLVRVRLPMRSAVAHPPGRGYLVENGFAELIQVALPDDGWNGHQAHHAVHQARASDAVQTTPHHTTRADDGLPSQLAS